MGEQELPPQALIMQLITGRFITESVGVVAKLGVPDMIADGEATAEHLASKTDMNPDAFYRVMRMLAMVGVFAETAPRTFALTPIGQTLRPNVPGSMLNMALWLTSPEHYKCWGELGYSVKTGLPAADKVLGKQVFDYFNEDNTALGEIFNNAMTSFATASHSTAVHAYDFSQFAKIVDVGGGHGALMSAILGANPSVKGVVYDLPSVVAGAPKLLAARGVADRCEAIGGDFFESVPPGADAYVASVVIHDWSDDKAAVILANCRKAMNPGGKVLLVDCVIPPGNDPYPGKAIDLEMLVMTPGGRERTAEEFTALFAKAGLKLTQIIPTMSLTCIIEGEAA
jgi:hypothetical protein